MRAEDRVWLLDVDNVIGSVRPRLRLLRARVQALREAVAPFHHAVAGYAVDDLTDDPIASILAELGIAPLRVARQPDAAEIALLAHARHVHAEGGRVFLVSSADRKFTELRDLGRLELLVWDELPVAGRLLDAAHHVHRVARPDGAVTDGTAADATVAEQPPHPAVPEQPPADQAPASVARSRPDRSFADRMLAALLTGIGAAVGHHLADVTLRALRRGRR